MFTKMKKIIYSADITLHYAFLILGRMNINFLICIKILNKVLYYFALFDLGANSKLLYLYDNYMLFFSHALGDIGIIILTSTLLRIIKIADMVIKDDKKN